MSLETWGLRVPEVCKVLLAPQESLAEGAGLGVTEPGGCPARRAPRVTEVSTAWLGFLGRRAIGVTLVLLGLRALQEKMENGVMMEKLAPGVCLGNLGHVVFWGPRVPQALQAHLV